MSLACARTSACAKFAHAHTGGISNSRAENSCVWQGTYFIQQTARPGVRGRPRAQCWRMCCKNGVTAPPLWLSWFKIGRRALLNLYWGNFHRVETKEIQDVRASAGVFRQIISSLARHKWFLCRCRRKSISLAWICTSWWPRSLSRSAAMLFFTCCKAARSFLRQLELHMKTVAQWEADWELQRRS